MTSRAFGAQTPRDLLRRAASELGQLESASQRYYLLESDGRDVVGSLAGSCAGSIWNLVDWLANSGDPHISGALARAGLETKEKLRDHVKAESPDLTLCWEVTNGYKHSELEGYTLAASQLDGALLSAPSSLGYGGGAAYRFTAKLKAKSGVKVPAVGVFTDSIAYWERFLSGLGL